MRCPELAHFEEELTPCDRDPAAFAASVVNAIVCDDALAYHASRHVNREVPKPILSPLLNAIPHLGVKAAVSSSGHHDTSTYQVHKSVTPSLLALLDCNRELFVSP